MTAKSCTIKGHNLCYRIGGQGVPVVLLHGFGEDGQVWEPVIQKLEPGCRLLVPDIPGSGCSALNPESTTMTDYAAILLELANQEQFEAFYLIGHSMGGYITLAFAEKYPDRLRGFCLFHSTSYADSDEKKTARQKSIDFIRRHGSASFIAQTTPNLFSEAFRVARANRVSEMIARYTNFSPDALVQYYEAMINRPDRRNVLKTFTKPIAWIIGRHDTAVPARDALAQCYLSRISQVLILENSGHMGMMEEPEKCLEFLAAYLEDAEIANR